MELVLGIDGGGSRTRALVATLAGEPRGWGESGPSNPHVVTPTDLRAALCQATARALADADATRVDLRAAHIGLAGVATDEEQGAVRALVQAAELLPAGAPVAVDHDLAIALVGGLGGDPGLVVCAGTGSAVYGRRADGREARAGGLGPFVDDGGSGFDLGRRALAHVARTFDGRAEAGLLSARLRDRLALDEARDLVRYGPDDRGVVLALAPLVVDSAVEGDDAAGAIVAAGCAELAQAAAAVARRLEWDDPPITVAGSVATHPGLWPLLATALAAELPRGAFAAPRAAPVVGAVALAARACAAE